MDNLSIHKVKGVREAMEEKKAKCLYLPPYSPDLSPIEPIWSKIKTLLRQISARTYRELTNALSIYPLSFNMQLCRTCR